LLSSNKELKFNVVSIRFDQLFKIITYGFLVLLVTRGKHDVLSGLNSSFDLLHVSTLLLLFLISHINIGFGFLRRIFAFFIVVYQLGRLLFHSGVFLGSGLRLALFQNFVAHVNFTKAVESPLEFVHSLLDCQVVRIH